MSTRDDWLLIYHDDDVFADYYNCLQQLIKESLSIKEDSDENLSGSHPSISPLASKYIINIPQGSRPKQSATVLAKYLSRLISQPDWRIVILDKPSKSNEVWEILDNDMTLHIKDESAPEKDTCYILRTNLNPHKKQKLRILRLQERKRGVEAPDDWGVEYGSSGGGDNSLGVPANVRIGRLNRQLFSSSRYNRTKKRKKEKKYTLPFTYYLLAVILTILFCALLHRAPYRKWDRRR
jgi:hypothetical protein